jgi:TolA-binding protein
LQLKNYAAAADAFEALIRKYPKSEMLEESLFDLGTCQYALARRGEAKRYVEAAKSFGALLEKFPGSKHGEESLFYRGEALYAADQKAEAAKVYGQLVKQFANSKWRGEALYAWGVAEEELGNSREATQRYEEYLREFGQLPTAGDVKLRLAEMVLKGGDAGRAAQLFGELAADTKNPAAERAALRQAFCFVKLEKDVDAAAAFARAATQFPSSKSAAEATISAGRLYYRAGKLDDAKAWLEKSARLDNPASAEAAHWLCRVLLKAGNAKQAAAIAAEKLATQREAPFAANLQLDRADALYEIPEQRPESLGLYAQFVKERPQHDLAPQALYGAAFTALRLAKYDEGLGYAQQFLKAYAKSDLVLDVQYVAAECNMQLKKYDAAQALYRELVLQHPKHADVDVWRVRQGLAAYLNKNYQAVISALSPVAKDLKSADGRAEANFLLGASYFFENKFGEAKLALAESARNSAKWRQADETLLLLARAEAKAGDGAAARADMRRLIKEHPQSKLLDEAYYRLGEVEAEAGELPAAIGDYEMVATKFAESPFAPFALQAKGWAEYKNKDFAKGVESFGTFLRKYGQHKLATDASYGRALCRRQAGDLAGAVADLDVVLKSNPEEGRRADVLFEKGLAQIALKDLPSAVTTLQEFVTTNSKHASADQALYEIGWALKSQDKHDAAAKFFEQLGQRHAGSPLAAEAWFHVGEDRYDQKDYAAAKQAYGKARAAKPSGELAEKAVYKLAWAEYQTSNYDKAQQYFAEQGKAFPRGALAADARFMQAECLFRQEKYAEAVEAYQAALQSKPSSPTAVAMLLLHAGQAAAQLKKWENSAALLTQLTVSQPDSPLSAEANYELGWAKQNLNQADEALEYYDVAATKSKGNVGARARFMRGELFFAAKKYDEASKEFQRAMYGYGGDEASADVKNWQAKSGYEAGRCAEVQITTARDAAAKQKLIADAERYYRFVVDRHPEHELAEISKKRLTALGKL